MILCDTGFIIATISTRDKNYHRAMAALDTIRYPVITTWPCLTEAMYLVGTAGQEKLHQQIETGSYLLPEPTFENALRACQLMRQYADTPMDFADASLVVMAEVLNETRILTFDRHFYVYRINGKMPFEVLPG